MSLFTPVRNGLQNLVDRRFKPAGVSHAETHEDEMRTVEQRLELLEQRLRRLESSDSPPD